MLLTAVILGVVEGLTEFLPVSSTGHLILAGHFLNFKGEVASTFEIFIQLGAILAIVFHYRSCFSARGACLPARQGPASGGGEKGQGFSGFRGLGLLFATTLPALVFGALFHGFIKTHLFNPMTVVIGLTAGSFWIFGVEKFCPRGQKSSVDLLTYREALFIGLFQCLSMWPGISRAGATILGAMMIGLDRKTATEYSFFAAAPVIAAASILDLYKSWDVMSAPQIPIFAVGFVVSALSAAFIMKFFIRYVSRHTLNLFAWYRLVLAAVVLLFWKS